MATELPILPKLIEVGDDGVKIDGEEFPWFISESGISTTVSANDVPGITFTLMAEEVRVVGKLRGGAE